MPAVPGYYAIHQDGEGYLRLKDADVNLNNDGNFRYGNLFDGNGNSIWYVTPQGYLQNGYFYLNVINGKTLSLSVEPKTKWLTEAIDGDVHGKMHLKTGGLYLCNDNNTITLKESPTAYYNACPITITEKSWSGPSADNLTLQSPQQVTYLRAYYTQKMDYEFYNDAGTKVSEKDKDRRVYAKLSYASDGDNKGDKWDINTTSGVIYNKTTSNVDVTATYTIEPADPIAYSLHSTPGTKSIIYTLQAKSLIPDAEMKYLLFSIKAGEDYRYPYDDGIENGGLVKPNGKGGTTTASVLTDPDTSPNLQISWKIQVDDEGFYTFQNLSSNKYLYYDEAPHASSDYGVLRLGTTPSDDKYKFRLYKTNNDDYGVCYQIIPYSKQFVVYKTDGIAKGFCAAFNNNNYKSQTPVISLFNANDNSQWCIYKYEAEYRVRSDFSFSGPASTSTTGDVTFTSEGWYGKYIKESPKTGNAQSKLAISGTYNTDQINYIWTVIGLDNYINHEGWTSRDDGVGMTYTNNKTFTFNVTSLPVSPASGVIQLQLRGGTQDQNSTTDPYKWTAKKTLGFTIMGDGEITFTEITSLSAIKNSAGAYKLMADVSDRLSANVTTFSGILDGNGHKVSGITQPLFVTLNNGTVHDLTLDNVDISGASGPVGAIAGTANGGSRIYNVGILGGSIGSADGYCGGLVGLLDGAARVINCFSFAQITGGSNKAGIVGYNSYASKSNDIRTMVMNCMFYGDISLGGTISPVYGGENIDNLQDQYGLNTYNYYRYESSYSKNGQISNGKYNCALAVEEQNLTRFEFYRQLLNSNRKLAAWYVTGRVYDANEATDLMAKWVLNKCDKDPMNTETRYNYPILKRQGKYPSIVNYDAEHAEPIVENDENDRNKGKKLGTLKVNISLGSEAPTGASLKTGQNSITLIRTDKDFELYNFNYDKVQLPYYNEVGVGNYTQNKVVTGWKITGMTDGSKGSFTSGDSWGGFNFADRSTYAKDLYGVSGSGRVFSQGAYFDVPDGVTEITIEPYWGNAVYVADEKLDKVYKKDYSNGTYVTGDQYQDGQSYSINGSSQTVYTSISNALSHLTGSSSVYDDAIVLVGNLHYRETRTPSSEAKKVTIMSADLDFDNEPDYSLIYTHNGRANGAISPIRFDFLNMPGLAMAQKPNGATALRNVNIFQPKGWFEVTNTCLIHMVQMEYDNGGKSTAPLILLGGAYDQFVSTQKTDLSDKNTSYIHVGSNAWFNEFANGTHGDGSGFTPHVPISVTGGDYGNFYLSGVYNPNATVSGDDAECYISGGRFKELAGAGLEQIQGNVTWLIDRADITDFYGGGINEESPITGKITVNIKNSHVNQYCGGPKFGKDIDKKVEVKTSADNCDFATFYGAGYGGISYNRIKTKDTNSGVNWGNWQNDYVNIRGKYKTKIRNHNNTADVDAKGIATDFDHEYFVGSDGNVFGRFYVKFASFSLAEVHNVTSELSNCRISGSFFGGGSLGKVSGTIKSTLTDCRVNGNVFGGGYSVTKPKIKIRKGGFVTNKLPSFNSNAGLFDMGEKTGTDDYEWIEKTDGDFSDGDSALDGTNIKTTKDLDVLGEVGGAELTIEGITIDNDNNAGSVIGTTGINTTGNVYGGGDASAVNGNTTVTLKGNTEVLGNVFGGGNEGPVSGSATVNIQE